MRVARARYITACQQLLALGVVLAVLTPALGVVSLDVVGSRPVQPPASEATGALAAATALPGAAALAAYQVQSQQPAQVALGSVEPRVREVSLTPAAGSARGVVAGVQATATMIAGGAHRVLSRPQRVTGYGAVGVTWSAAEQVDDDEIALQVRTRTRGTWSAWTDLAYDAEHAPDPGTAEARHARPGTDPLLVGRVGQVQVRATTPAAVPADMRLSVIDPGRSSEASRAPALTAATATTAAPTAARTTVPTTGAATAYTPMPGIFSRAQWGADEGMRQASSLRYYEVHAGFVHHTVNANNYSEGDVPAIIRSIYAYHVKSRGWSDIGYNFLVDRFGRVWEGRYGGVDRPVVGAHTLGYNEYSFAMSTIGNFELVKPTQAVLAAYGAVFAWKLSLHGVSAASTAQRVGKSTFQAINGHRDAASTACPGKYLYAQLPTIRALAAAGQAGWAGRELASDLTGTPHPDLIVRRTSDQRVLVVPTQGSGQPLGQPIDTGLVASDADLLLNVGDWDRDGFGDFVLRARTTKLLWLFRGDGQGHFAGPTLLGDFRGVRLITAVGDMTGDGFPDLIAQPAKSVTRIYPGAGMAGLLASYPAYGKVKAKRAIGIGRMDSDGAPDVLYAKKKNLVLYRGNGPGGLSGGATKVRGRLKGFDRYVGISDIDLSGYPDVIARQRSSGKAFLFSGNGRRFAKPVPLGDGLRGYDLIG